MKLKYKAALILLPLISIIAYQVQSYRDFSKDIDNLRETVVIPGTEEALLSANIQFLSAQLSTSLQRAIIALQSGHEKGVKEAIQKNILTREQRQVELQKLREVSTEFLLQEDKFGTQLAKELEDLITKVDTLNERITSEIAASSGTAEEINRISREVGGELVPLENKLFFTLTVVLENSVSKVAETRKIFTEAKKRGVQKLYLVSILSLIVFISIVLFLNFCIVNPIKKLTKGTEIIGKGDLEHRVEIKTRDEIGELGSAFNQMTENLKEVTASGDELNKEITERKKAEGELEKHRMNLEEIVRERTAELDKRISEVEQLNSAMVNLLADLRVSNENLELTTRQLSDANKELESFSYSVSHDLRAPLRAIDGFSQMLVKDYGDKLDEGGQHQLDVIHGSARQMGQLIDDLLAFSRLGRKGISMSEIDMGVLAQEVLEQLQLGETERTARLNIDTLPPANGDRVMIREVFVNLLSNAMKFTRPGKAPVIEVTGTVDENETVYSVKDKGVGFDMKYADKLFQVFQRLHSAEEFEGTGIGLALVQRIVHRHGGRVWAEGKVNKGATFNFSLPRS